jgi:oligo-alginate lyase
MKRIRKPAEGKCLAFGDGGWRGICRRRSGRHLRWRSVQCAPSHLLDENVNRGDRPMCAADKERLLDVALHLRGQWSNLPEGEKWTPPDKDGYRYLTEATIRRVSSLATITVDPRPDWRVAVTLIADAPVDLVTALGVGSHAADRVPMVMVRRQAKDLTLVWCISLDGRPIQAVWAPDATKRPAETIVQIKLPDGQRLTLIADMESGNLKVLR